MKQNLTHAKPIMTRRTLAAAAGTCLFLAAPWTPAAVLLTENFGGTGAALNGTSADFFDSALTSAGGSGTWVAGTSFLDNGVVSVDANVNFSAYLNLGSYITTAAGSAAGRFDLTLTISPTAGSWIAVGFAKENTPSITRNFNNTGTGAALTTGLASLIYRAQTGVAAPNGNGELDMFGGTTNTNAVDGPDGNTGNRTVVVTLDLTPAGGYNGTTNFGTVRWSDSVLGTLGSFTYTTSQTFGSILISEATSSGGTVSGLSFSQVPEPSGAALLGPGAALGLSRRRN